MCKIKVTLFAVGSIVCTQMVNAQNYYEVKRDSISEVLITENRLQIPFSKRNKNIEILTKEDISKMPVQSVNEILLFVNGVDVRQRGPFGTQADISVDGGSFDQVLILLNGVKISDPQTGHHAMNIPVSMDAIERIEVLRGPMARVYGVNALTGAINIVTKEYQKQEMRLNFQIGSSFEDKEVGDGQGIYWGNALQLLGQFKAKAIENLLNISAQKSNGQRYNSKSQNIRGYYQGNVAINQLNTMDWSLGYIDNHFGANGYYASPADKESYEIVQTVFTHLSSKHYLTDNFYISPRFSNRYNKDDYRFYKDDLQKGRSLHNNNVFSFELNSRLVTEIGEFGVGAEFRNESIKSNNLGDHSRENIGSFLEYRTELLSKFTFHLGAYGNYNADFGWKLYPGIDMSYQIKPTWRLNVNLGKSQRIPSFTDLYLNQPTNVGNPNLYSENALQYETSLLGSIGRNKVEFRYFYREIHDFIDWVKQTSNKTEQEVINTPFVPYNLGKNEIQGFSASISRKIELDKFNFLNINLNYNYLSPKEQNYQSDILSKYILESLKHQFIARLVYGNGKWYVSSSNRWIQRELNSGYFVSDIRFDIKLNNMNIYTDLTNLTNAQYLETGAVYLPKRWFNLGVKYHI